MLAFKNPLAEPTLRREPLPAAKWVLWGLLLACLVPRVLMAGHLEVICADGAYFIELAQQIDRDQPVRAVGQYDSNLFPLILILLHDAGFRWEDGGAWWGVFCGTLAVLPLFGWMRRQFDDRVAIVSCLLYAAHPKLIEWSPEVVREPTFWLLLTSSLYFTHRALAELRIRWFVFGGITTFLAIATRFEGWFLLGAIALWAAFRFRALPVARWRLAAGLVCLAACFPVCMEGIARGYGYQHWPLGGLQRLQLVHEWAESLFAEHGGEEQWQQNYKPALGLRVEQEPSTTQVSTSQKPFGEPSQDSPHLESASDATAPSHTNQGAEDEVPENEVLKDQGEKPQLESGPPAITSPAESTVNETHVLSLKRSTRKTAWVYLRTLERGFTPVFGILLTIGYLFHWRLQTRWDLIPMFLWSVATLCGVWIHLWAAQESSSRYATSIVILATSFAALGTMSLSGVISRVAARIKPLWRQRPGAVVAAWVLLFTIVGWADALTSGYEGREARVELGNWIATRFGPGETMLGSHRWSQANHYARGRYYTLPAIDCTLGDIDSLVHRLEPRVIVLSGTEMIPEQWDIVSEHCKVLGYQRLSDDDLPELCRAKIVVLQKGSSPRVARTD
ncbi:MAG: glycosyltransferase family 39 protein [Pirellulales bacterium]|nr:glycosyltransferase family 39 protein [Pirellulales bacterium]